ncbi:hypothetical protein GPECTOR_30g186 [Gonium pectorale]|uniref:SET domain-containing protein n=1 Tax=Gonium pectorale TaxID=33097 RepID=A0A150GE09_GONPE|nr:hypothetical protein GPECTOR_30g186 [Gonium pectorale]|eukprot:KXZ48091.1 hypothetical protein GPECTOR_30g186 [Gonium pectorale]
MVAVTPMRRTMFPLHTAARVGEPGQVRVCGLTFDTALAPAVRSAQEAWQEGLSQREPQHAILAMEQLAFTGSRIDQRLSRAVVCNKLARLLGLHGDNGRLEAPLPEGPVVLEGAMQPCGDPARGGAGLQATVLIRKSEVLGVVGGYVLPSGSIKNLLAAGHRHCRPAVAARLARVVAESRADTATAWSLLAGGFRVPLPVEMALPLLDEGSVLPSAVELSMLGYGNLLALVNDPRVDPRDWTPDNDVDLHNTAERANCTVVPVCVRGLVLPVLVALRDIAPGEQLLRDYGADWWRQLASDWEVAEHDGLDVVRLLHGTQQQRAQDAEPGPLSPAPQPDEVVQEPAVAPLLDTPPAAMPLAAAASTGPLVTAAARACPEPFPEPYPEPFAEPWAEPQLRC